MEYEGNIIKMRTEMACPVRYYFKIGSKEFLLNDFLGKKLRMIYDGQINCISCGKRTKTSFGGGFCYSCFKEAPEASRSIISPELSMAQFGIARDMEWAKKNDLIDHFVYLALSSAVKVGVTRYHQIPVRWIDQGASEAIRIAKTPNRHISGIIECFLKKYYTDKTNWRDMVQNKVNHNIDLSEEKQRAINFLPGELKKYAFEDKDITKIEYPVIRYPEKAVSVSLDKQPFIEGCLLGIKGQYLFFDSDRVINIRKHNGYFIKVEMLS